MNSFTPDSDATDYWHSFWHSFRRHVSAIGPENSTAYLAYLIGISVVGLLLAGWGIVQLPNYIDSGTFLLLLLLAAIATIATTSVAISDEAGVTYYIAHAIAIAAVPAYGIAAGALIIAVATVCVWIIKPTNEKTWKKSLPQLAFNVGMQSLAMGAAGYVLTFMQGLLSANTALGLILPWALAAYVFEEVNLWLLIGVFQLQHRSEFEPLKFWKEERWATQIGALSMAVGGGILAYAVAEYNWVAIVIFFMPILLSAYAFRLYVRQMQSHLDNLEAIVAERTHDLSELNRQKDAFLAVLTHDMMTPLANIQLCAEIIQGAPDLPSEIHYLSQSQLRSQQMLHTMVRNILDIERLQAGEALPMKKVSCDLNQLVGEALEIMQPEASQKGIHLTSELADEPTIVLVDRLQMERVLLNLLSNAVKYSPLDAAVVVKTSVNGQYARVDLADTGYGIPADELSYIFERFRRVKQLKDRATGTGLGLAITKALVEQHDGMISVESEVGQGSTFTVELPL